MAQGSIRPIDHSRSNRGVRLYHRVLDWRLRGLPDSAEGVPMGTIEWLFASGLRMPGATAAALVVAWTGLLVSLWIGAFSAIGSIVVTAFGVAISGHVAGVATFTSRTSGGIVFLSAIIAGAVGFGSGFSAAYASSLFGGLSVVAAALFVGIVVGLIFGFVGTAAEPLLLSWRGYRRPSQREWDAHLKGALQTCIDSMQLTSAPHFRIIDSAIPQAWTYSRNIVISKGLLEGLDAGELAGVLAHELTHWRRGDGLAMRMVWSFAWPVAMCYSLGMFLSGARFGPSAAAGAAAGADTPHADAKSTMKGTVTFLGFLGWMLLWPAWLLTRFVVVPATSHDSRSAEYEADAGAAAAGLDGELVRALERMQAFEQARNAWDAALVSTHPPIELRIEALEAQQFSVPTPSVEPVTARRVGYLFTILVVLVGVAISPHIPVYHHPHDNWWW